MRVRWTPAAAADLELISSYLKERHPEYLERTMRRLYRSIQSLKHTPYLGRPGREEGTPVLVFPPLPYVAVYRIAKETVEVLRIYHAARGEL